MAMCKEFPDMTGTESTHAKEHEYFEGPELHGQMEVSQSLKLAKVVTLSNREDLFSVLLDQVELAKGINFCPLNLAIY
jgi:hypothetical protein